MAQGAPDDTGPQSDSIVISKFEGMKNTVDPERLEPGELARGQNIDIDDRGQVHRRRGYTRKLLGNFHSLFTTNGGRVYGVMNGVLGRINPDYGFLPVLGGIARDRLAYVQVGPMLYFSSRANQGKLDLRVPEAANWGRIEGDSYWFSPVVHPETPPVAPPGPINPNAPLLETSPLLPPVGGRLFGNPPQAEFLTWFNGRIYLSCKRTVWATELFLYDYVDKTKGFVSFEEDVTGLGMVEDGVYVGTAAKLYFLQGAWGEGQKRTIVYESGVLPGSMIQVEGSLLSPEARMHLELPSPTAHCVLMITTTGIVAAIAGGRAFDLTRSQFWFPWAVRAATLFRMQDGMHTVVSAQDSGGTPVDAARFGDYLDATLIRANHIG